MEGYTYTHERNKQQGYPIELYRQALYPREHNEARNAHSLDSPTYPLPRTLPMPIAPHYPHIARSIGTIN